MKVNLKESGEVGGVDVGGRVGRHSSFVRTGRTCEILRSDTETVACLRLALTPKLSSAVLLLLL